MRLRKMHDKIPTTKEGQSFAQLVEEYNGSTIEIYGSVGRTGEKVHTLIATYLEIDGEQVIVSAYATCGAQNYKNHSSASLSYQRHDVNCSKCLKNKAYFL